MSDTPADHIPQDASTSKWLITGRRWIFGTKRPPVWVRLLCYLDFAMVFLFLVWHSVAYLALQFRHLIFDIKNVDVDQLIGLRAEQLHFKANQFLQLVLNQHLIAIACWLTVGVATVLIWRKNRSFLFWLALGLGTYFGTLFLFLGERYFHEDLTWFDKIAYSIMGGGSILAYFWVRSEKNLEENPEETSKEN